ncbi:type II toxin-antitoxin system VapC family toxin [Aurantimonas sp. C2-6-R+9]|uniref:type II toxin-antitoxin system VapC family toxin n=1 Tax=unclassified Aurantimonas TaxID=2638230 RepID=UPI002E193A86|nr:MULTISPECIES: type II toxin-antitoxin system VapC family toxin [unclassified Aurantimonas]MEC5290249.1 type II toxin-antitoxin system VapC family toxin [Aurantimonas sp. C2-3-R2]MEC5321688.1 type II toxin-antitoxin system VapC family toxin [Aurantimonas sp. A3-2-R12]MEC5380360.1 type II toxin-antitoxin system VapC family toxin [Aurantimonas sp. C2-6-R+9]MEC5411313.1 type II toxin-antitoxin system VapC family toxin [Aurantimonas sp. C2-4-R8]
MRLLLDTHTLAWWLLDHPRLSATIRNLLKDTDNAVFVSAVSALEAATKFRLGKWPEVGPMATAFEEVMRDQDLPIIPIAARHAARAGLMDGAHRDPFDRILAAQAEIEDLVLATNDPRFTDFGTKTVW